MKAINIVFNTPQILKDKVRSRTACTPGQDGVKAADVKNNLLTLTLDDDSDICIPLHNVLRYVPVKE